MPTRSLLALALPLAFTLAGALACDGAPPAARTCRPGGACDPDVAPGLRAATAAFGWRDLATEPPEALPQVRLWVTGRPPASGRVIRVVGEGASAAAEALSWWPSGARDSADATERGRGPSRRVPVCPSASRRGPLTVCPGPRRGAPYAANLRRMLDSLGAWRLPGEAAAGDTLRLHRWVVAPDAIILETRDRAGRYRSFGYNRPAPAPAGAPPEVDRLWLLLRDWQ